MERTFIIEGVVVGGQQLGRKLGFPTANVMLNGELALEDGVYAAMVELEHSSKSLLSIANLGSNPSVGGCERRLEVHIIGYDGEPLYGSEIRVTLFKFIRSEMHFSSLEELIAQIRQDIELVVERYSDSSHRV